MHSTEPKVMLSIQFRELLNRHTGQDGTLLISPELMDDFVSNFSFLAIPKPVSSPQESHIESQVLTQRWDAPEFLRDAVAQIDNRASDRDTEAERSMKACVLAFNALFGTELTEEQGWGFMVLLKLSRSKGGAMRIDDYTDMAGYSALMGEAAVNERG